MKLKTFSKLKVGDQVTVKTWYELLATKDVTVCGSNVLKIVDKKNFVSSEVFTCEMQGYCGGTFKIKEINWFLCKVRLEGTSKRNFTRKMLKEEVIKHD